MLVRLTLVVRRPETTKGYLVSIYGPGQTHDIEQGEQVRQYQHRRCASVPELLLPPNVILSRHSAPCGSLPDEGPTVADDAAIRAKREGRLTAGE